MRLAIEKKMKQIYEKKKMRESAEKGQLVSPVKTPVKTPGKSNVRKTPNKYETPTKSTAKKIGTWAFKEESIE